MFLSSLSPDEVSELRQLLVDAGNRLDARLFDADLESGDPSADLVAWFGPRQHQWTAAQALAQQQWGPVDGAFCAHIAVSADASLPPVWPRNQAPQLEPRLRFVASVVTESVLVPATAPPAAIQRCRERALTPNSSIAGLFRSTGNAPGLTAEAGRILRRLPDTPNTLAIRGMLSRLRETGAKPVVTATPEGHWLAAARVGAQKPSLLAELRDCLGADVGELR